MNLRPVEHICTEFTFYKIHTLDPPGFSDLTMALNFMCHDGRRESEIVLEKRKKLLIIVCLLTNVDFYL